MRIANFFIDKPIFATVIAVMILIVGSLSYVKLPIEQYPQVVPPTIRITASYPGANASTVADTVATPLEQQINGVEDMLYMDSQSTDDGQMRLTITFKLGTNLDEAQVLVQNRVAIAEPRLPEEVRRIGIVVTKNSPDLLLVINLYSPDKHYDQTYLGNYAVLQIMDNIRRIEGVGDIRLVGASEYAMRIWLNPDRMNSYQLAPNDVIEALRAQNVEIASGTLNEQPQNTRYGFEYGVETKGRLNSIEAFEAVIVKSSSDGRLVRLKDIARVELGAQDYATKSYLGSFNAVALPVFQQPGTNALATADAIIASMKKLATHFPPGLAYQIAYNPTEYIAESIKAVRHTIFEAIALVVLVIFVFLQSWRAAMVPIVAIPISLVGTFALMYYFGFSLNFLTLFALVLAVGIVVDDAIVVVENMERNLQLGLSAREAARKTMSEVGGALIAIGLVLMAVFFPTLFLEGLSGRFFLQLGAIMSAATAISVFVSLTLSPSMATLLLKSFTGLKKKASVGKSLAKTVNQFITRVTRRYGQYLIICMRRTPWCMLIYCVLMALTLLLFLFIPKGFIPKQDQGYFIISIQLPPGSSLTRTDKVVHESVQKILALPGVKNAVAFTGFAGATFTNASNAAAIFVILQPFSERETASLSYAAILENLREAMNGIKEASIVVIPPPPVRGIGNAGGFKMMLQDRSGLGINTLFKTANLLIAKANQLPEVTSVFTFFDNATPRMHLMVDREKAERLSVPVANVWAVLEGYIGSVFVNEFNYLGRLYRVIVQADAPYRLTTSDLLRLKVRNNKGDMIPVGAVATLHTTTGPSRVLHYNLYPAIDIIGDASPGTSTGEALTAMEKLALDNLPNGMNYEWTEIAYQQKSAANVMFIALSLSVLFVFLVLAAQYESWTLPLIIILIIPMCLFSAFLGMTLFGMENNIMSQIGFVVLIGLASKNAILIVEFAHQLQMRGFNRWQAAFKAAQLRFRPIAMTSFAFILGVLPLVLATGAGAEMRKALGIAVFSGMLGVTFFGLIFTPIFYALISGLFPLKTK